MGGSAARVREVIYDNNEHAFIIIVDGPTETRKLRIEPMPSEDMQSGRVVRRCEVIPSPPPSEMWEYTWSDPSGRIISGNDILSITVISLVLVSVFESSSHRYPGRLLITQKL